MDNVVIKRVMHFNSNKMKDKLLNYNKIKLVLKKKNF